jgi:hypothetical protein
MNKTNLRKLSLHRETLIRLDDSGLDRAKGGIDKLCTGLRSTCVGNSANSCNYTDCCVVQATQAATCGC